MSPFVVAKMTVYLDFPIHNAKKYSRLGKILTNLSTPLLFCALLIKNRQLSGAKNHRVETTPSPVSKPGNPRVPTANLSNRYDKNYPDAVFAALRGLPFCTNQMCVSRRGRTGPHMPLARGNGNDIFVERRLSLIHI